MLTELQVKNEKPRNTSYMVRDDKGLYLRVDTSGKSTGFCVTGEITRNINYRSARILICP